MTEGRKADRGLGPSKRQGLGLPFTQLFSKALSDAFKANNVSLPTPNYNDKEKSDDLSPKKQDMTDGFHQRSNSFRNCSTKHDYTPHYNKPSRNFKVDTSPKETFRPRRNPAPTRSYSFGTRSHQYNALSVNRSISVPTDVLTSNSKNSEVTIRNENKFELRKPDGSLYESKPVGISKPFSIDKHEVVKPECKEDFSDGSHKLTINYPSQVQGSFQSQIKTEQHRFETEENFINESPQKTVKKRSSVHSPEQIKAINSCIQEVYETRCLCEEDIKNYEEALRKINCRIRRDVNGYKASFYGSFRSRFVMTESDVNVNVMAPKSFPGNVLLAFYQDLKNNNNIIRLEKNMEHKSPYITFEVKNLDLEWKATQKESIACSTADLINQYTTLDERVVILGIAFRYWGKICDIAEEEDGTLHSLCFPLMLIHFLQQHDPPVLPVLPEQPHNTAWVSRNKEEIGALWLALLHYYGSKFKWKDQVVTINQKKPLTKSEKNWQLELIGIEEPSKPAVNVAKSVVSCLVLDFIQMCFQSTHIYFSNSQWAQQNPVLSCFVENETNSEKSADSESISASETQDELYYSFNEAYFTGGKVIPIYCSICDKSGHCSEECFEASQLKLPALPLMTPFFQKEIDNFCIETYKKYNINADHEKKRYALLNELKDFIRFSNYFSDVVLELFGSTCNGFGFADSDMDISLKFPHLDSQALNHKQLLWYLLRHLRKNGRLKTIFFIGGAKIPVVKFIHRESGLKGDISMGNSLAVYNSQLIRTYSEIDMRFKCLGYTIKAFARNSRIMDYSTRGLSSYALLLMVIHFLQQREPPVLPVLQELHDGNPRPEIIVDGVNIWYYSDVNRLDNVWKIPECNKETVGQLCLGFFQYYTEKLDRKNTVISIRQKKLLSVQEKGWHANLFCIEDPFMVENNLGQRVHPNVATKIMKAFHTARRLFGTPLEHVPHSHRDFQDYLLDPRIISDSKLVKDIRCRKCGLIGHIMRFCPHRNLPPEGTKYKRMATSYKERPK